MNIEELMEVGNVFIQWGKMLITFGVVSMLLGAVLLYICYCVLETQK